jgi:5-methylcytosine-specific restriction endonuclease McrA
LIGAALIEVAQLGLGSGQVMQKFVHESTIPLVAAGRYTGYSKCMTDAAETCTVEGCELPVMVKMRGLCRSDYALFIRTGNTELVKARRIKADDTATHKTCTKCAQSKPRADFYKSNRDKDGLRGWCKPCTKANNTAGYLGNRDAVLARQAEHNKTPERVAYMAAYRPAYYESNREAYVENAAARRSRERAAFVDKGITVRALRKRHGDQCVFCDVTMLFGKAVPTKHHPQLATLEHMIPLTRGGKHSWDNARLSCYACNTRKNDKTPAEYIAYRQRMATTT